MLILRSTVANTLIINSSHFAILVSITSHVWTSGDNSSNIDKTSGNVETVLEQLKATAAARKGRSSWRNTSG